MACLVLSDQNRVNRALLIALICESNAEDDKLRYIQDHLAVTEDPTLFSSEHCDLYLSSSSIQNISHNLKDAMLLSTPNGNSLHCEQG
jgi:hypothetical protein